MRLILSILTIALIWMSARAADDGAALLGTDARPARPVTHSVMVGGGGRSLTDSYLTPFATRGWSVGIASERIQAMRRHTNMSAWLAAELDFGRTHNALTTNGTQWQATFHVEAAPLWRLRPWSIPLTLAVGPGLDLLVGAHYRPVNGNNPVAAQASAAVGLSARAVYRFNAGRLPLTVGYRMSMPLAGAFFGPDYGELYYEIYLGNHSGLCHFGWPGNRLEYRHLLWADIHLGATALRVGYRLRALTQSSQGLTTNLVDNSFVIGVTTTRLSLNPGMARKVPTVVLGD